MNEVSRSYQDELLKALTDPAEAAAYLNAAIDEGSTEVFIMALQNVASAHKLKQCEQKQSLKKKPPSDKELSQLSDLHELLGNMGLRFFCPDEKARAKIEPIPM